MGSLFALYAQQPVISRVRFPNMGWRRPTQAKISTGRLNLMEAGGKCKSQGTRTQSEAEIAGRVTTPSRNSKSPTTKLVTRVVADRKLISYLGRPVKHAN